GALPGAARRTAQLSGVRPRRLGLSANDPAARGGGNPGEGDARRARGAAGADLEGARRSQRAAARARSEDDRRCRASVLERGTGNRERGQVELQLREKIRGRDQGTALIPSPDPFPLQLFNLSPFPVAY